MKAWHIVLMAAQFVVAIAGFTILAVRYKDYGYDHKWHREYVCPLDAHVFWSQWNEGVCPDHGIPLELKTVRRDKDGEIDFIEKIKIEVVPSREFDSGACLKYDSENKAFSSGPCPASPEEQ